MSPDQHQKFIKEAFDAFLEVRRCGECLPSCSYLPYDIVDLTSLQWPTMGDMLIQDELRELTNNLNAWLDSLRRWHAWTIVARGYSEDDKWELEDEFITTIATYCLLKPSSIRDTFTLVATNGMHQVRLAVDPTYKDRLPLDRAPWDKPTYPPRRKKEDQLATVLQQWPESSAFLQSLRCLDDKATREATSNFRNLISHSIAPRFSSGVTRMVTRTVVQATKNEPRGDGCFNRVPIPDAIAIRYGFGGTGPLDLNKAWEINQAQFYVAVDCFNSYIAMLSSAVTTKFCGD